MQYFGQKLQDLRKKCNLTQAELANKAGISTSTIGMYEQNRRRPNFQILKKICDILSTHADYLLEENSNTNVSDLYTISYDFINNLNNSKLRLGEKILDKYTAHKVQEIMQHAIEQALAKAYQLLI